MIKSQQKRILEFISTLAEAQSEIVRLLNMGTQNTLMNLFVDCQESAVQLGTYIENIEGEGTQTVALLEEYYELLYKVSFEPNEITIRALEKQLVAIEYSVRTELKPNKIEALFLPYKASMADSLQTIWEAALADPDCDAYICPIPYYDLNADGSFGEMHYEGNLYSADIPITDWRKYDIKSRHPDVIFIHNPYDNANFVTMVHSGFFSQRIRDFTDLLVYVPYFVVSGGLSEPLVILPGTLYSHKVILESEQIREQYVQVFKKFESDNHCEGGFGRAEDKFVALGSPKYDVARRAKCDDCEIPGEYRKLIEMPDGQRKKVVFYNTTISGILNGNTEYLIKLQSVLKAFHKRDDVVLWWRPHPLMKASIKSMRPYLLDTYERIVEDYCREGWGIYDADERGLDTAIAYCDVYYGDRSSVTSLVEACGKKVYYQTVDRDESGADELLSSQEFYHTNLFMIENELFTKTNADDIFKANNTEDVFDFVKSLPQKDKSSRALSYHSISTENNKIYFFPHNDTLFSIYDINTRNFETFNLDLNKEFYEPLNGDPNFPRHFFNGIFYKNKVFFISCAYRNMVAFNFDTKEVEHCLDLRSIFPKEKMHSIFFGYAWLNETTILLPCLYTNEVLEFSLETYAYKIYKLGRSDRFFHQIFQYGGEYFFVGRQPFVAKWNYHTGEFTYYNNLPDGFGISDLKDWTWFMDGIVPYKNKLILSGGDTNMILEFEFDTCRFRKLDAFDELFQKKTKLEACNTLSFSTAHLVDKGIWYFIWKHQTLYKYDIANEVLEKMFDIKLRFTAEGIANLNNKFIDNTLKSDIAVQDRQIEPCGTNIYEYCKNAVVQQW